MNTDNELTLDKLDEMILKVKEYEPELYDGWKEVDNELESILRTR